MGGEGLVGGLGGFLGLDQGFEDGVDPAEDGCDGAEVGGEGDGFAEEVLSGEVRRDVGAAEAVDRLFGVADDEQAAFWDFDVAPVLGFCFGATRDPDGELDLDRVGVLELVQQEPLEALVQRCADSRVPAQEVAGENQQVVELQAPFLTADPGRFQHALGDPV